MIEKQNSIELNLLSRLKKVAVPGGIVSVIKEEIKWLNELERKVNAGEVPESVYEKPIYISPFHVPYIPPKITPTRRNVMMMCAYGLETIKLILYGGIGLKISYIVEQNLF